MKKYLLGIIIVALFAAATMWWLKREPTLAELQKQYLLAQTKADSAKVVDRLEKYYLHLSIPDTIRQRVENEVAAQVDTTKITLAKMAPDTNVYRLEGKLQNILRLAAIARARGENQTFQNLIRQARTLAQTVDTGTQNNYWTPFVDEISAFNKDQALYWLKAQKSESLCSLYQKDADKIADVERYAALGLNFLQRAKDERVRLDIIQRLQRILYFHHSQDELSIALAQKALPQANQIKYHLRSNGLMYVQATTLSQMERKQAALALHETILNNAEKFWQIKDMDWFTKKSLIEKGEICRELGEFEQSWNAYREAAKLPLDQTETIDLQVLKFNLLFATSYYEQAVDELKKAILLAEREGDQYKRMICLNNFGALYARLSDYDLALAYYKQAQSLFTPDFPNAGTRLLVFINMADMLVVKKDSIQFERIIKEAQKLIKLTSSPYRRAQLLSNIGLRYQKTKKYSAAIKYYHQADSIAYQNGFLRFALLAKMDLVDCMIALSRFQEAKSLTAEIKTLAKRINDIERLIDAYDRTARIHYKEGNIAQAVESSNELRHAIKEMSARFNYSDRLIAYRQKVYDFLKNAALYDIALQRQEIAWAKLDEAKAYALKNRLLNNQTDNHRHEAIAHDLNLELVRTKLPAKSLLIDYMMMQDTLYAFVSDRDRPRLLRKRLDMEALRKTAGAYKDSIHNTFDFFQKNHDPNQISALYTATAALAQQLYQNLLGWPEIEASLQKSNLLYIIPDEFLYEIPFATLIADASNAQTFLVKHAAVLTVPSVSLLPAVNSSNGASTQPQTKKVLMSVDRRFPGAKQFVDQSNVLFPFAEELTIQDSSLTKEAVLAQLQKNYLIYIFLGHGQANQEYPDRGYIELSVKTLKAPSAKIFRLTMADLKTINWRDKEMVVLIGCETADGKLYRGTGITGLQQEFFSLGVKNVLGNLWEADATHTIPQTQDFLTIWIETGNPMLALQVSQSKAVQALQGHRYYQHPHPYFWGSAVVLTAAPH